MLAEEKVKVQMKYEDEVEFYPNKVYMYEEDDPIFHVEEYKE
jgi:hypothetical protein